MPHLTKGFFSRGNYLDAITQINTVVFDKTGTLTQGVFSVQAISAAEGVSQKELLQLIASIESFSNHPIAKPLSNMRKNKVYLLTRH